MLDLYSITDCLGLLCFSDYQLCTSQPDMLMSQKKVSALTKLFGERGVMKQKHQTRKQEIQMENNVWSLNVNSCFATEEITGDFSSKSFGVERKKMSSHSLPKSSVKYFFSFHTGFAAHWYSPYWCVLYYSAYRDAVNCFMMVWIWWNVVISALCWAVFGLNVL